MPTQSEVAIQAFKQFVETPIDQLLDEFSSSRVVHDASHEAVTHSVMQRFAQTVERVPAYRAFLAEHGIDPRSVQTLEDFSRLPLLTKAGYVRKYPLAARCRDGRLSACDMIAMSSGSTGEPTVWPRFIADEFAIAARFEQVFHDAFAADSRSTLAVVCFPLGTWVGGMFTASCCRHLAAKGYPLTVVTPGNQKAEIFRAVRELGSLYDQVVLLGYPPFLKDVIDSGRAEGIDWRPFALKLVLAGEVFSEDWRTLMGERAGLTRPLFDSASLYGTADGGVLGNETPLTVCIRRFLSSRPEDARALFGEARLPTLVQYDPRSCYFELHEGTLVFSGGSGVPLVRYHISDHGGLITFDEMLRFCAARGFDPVAEVRAESERGVRPMPFAWVFGRSHFAVSYYGANVFPEMVSIGLEQAAVKDWVTGKFVMEVVEDHAHDLELTVAVELAPGEQPSEQRRATAADSILTQLLRLNSEFSSYVPRERQLPRVTLWPAGHPEYFPVGVKHRYSRQR